MSGLSKKYFHRRINRLKKTVQRLPLDNPNYKGFSTKTVLGGVLFACLVVGLTSITSGSRHKVSASVSQPNIVVVITDDQAQMDGRLYNYLPNIKSVFYDHGLTFTDFHSETNQCCPGRAGFLSGQHATNNKVAINSADHFNPKMSLATQLHSVGYYNFLVGKYMNGYASTKCRKNPSNCWPNVPPGWDHFADIDASDSDNSASMYYNYDMWVDGSTTAVHYGSTPADYSTDVISNRAVGLINNAPTDKPIFAWLAPPNPHGPNTVAPRYSNYSGCNVPAWRPANYNEADVSDKPAYVQAQPLATNDKNKLGSICKGLLAVDDLVANVRSALAAQGRLDNTIFIITGDNGEASKEHRLGGKGDPYETALPFTASWPAQLGTTPATVNERVQNIDLAPTLCVLAGCSMGPYPNGQATTDGWNFAGLILGTATTIDRDAVFEDMPAGNRPAPPWYSVTTTAQSPLASQACASAGSGGCIWHYTEYPTTGEKELYDKSNGPCWTWQVGQPGDPCELDNLIRPGSSWTNDPTNASILQALQTRLAQLKAEKGH